MSRKKCAVCGLLFHTVVSSKRYCSDECRRVARRDKQRQWQSDNPDYMKKYMQQYRSKE
ncbi:hypothetical protein [Vagococcus elongatus]